jgi:hypothetical protein
MIRWRKSEKEKNERKYRSTKDLHICTVQQWYQKHFFTAPTDARYYKFVEKLKQFKIIILAPTCFGSCTNHHQGAVLCFAETTNMVYL